MNGAVLYRSETVKRARRDDDRSMIVRERVLACDAMRFDSPLVIVNTISYIDHICLRGSIISRIQTMPEMIATCSRSTRTQERTIEVRKLHMAKKAAAKKAPAKKAAAKKPAKKAAKKR